MKKQYTTPEAEKVTFDYADSVTASYSSDAELGDARADAAPGPDVHWVCAKCWQYDSWIDETGMCKGHY